CSVRQVTAANQFVNVVDVQLPNLRGGHNSMSKRRLLGASPLCALLFAAHAAAAAPVADNGASTDVKPRDGSWRADGTKRLSTTAGRPSIAILPPVVMAAAQSSAVQTSSLRSKKRLPPPSPPPPGAVRQTLNGLRL